MFSTASCLEKEHAVNNRSAWSGTSTRNTPLLQKLPRHHGVVGLAQLNASMTSSGAVEIMN